MKTSYLFPNYFRWIGVVIFVPALTMLILNTFSITVVDFCYNAIGVGNKLGGLMPSSSELNIGYQETSFTRTILPIITIIGLSFIAFSKEKVENEITSQIRKESFMWSIVVCSIIFVLVTLFFYSFAYLYFLGIFIDIIYLLFILKFRISLSRLKKN